jgi:hypothetical protein
LVMHDLIRRGLANVDDGSPAKTINGELWIHPDLRWLAA